jgi:hypothetical protein
MIKKNELLINKCIDELQFKNTFETINDDLIIALYNYSNDWISMRRPYNLPCNPFPEKHPYKHLVPISKEFKKFIIGTFPPISYYSDNFDNIVFCNGSKVSTPQIPFYHGNRQKLWEYLMKSEDYTLLSKNKIERRSQIINFLRENKINYSDIIDYCQRSIYNADDANLYNIVLNNDLLDVINRSSSDLLFVFNTGSLFTKSGFSFNKSDKKLNPKTFVFDMFVKLMIDNGYEVKLKVGNLAPITINYTNKKQLSKFKNIIRFDLFVNNKLIKVVAGPSPADGDGNIKLNNIYLKFVREFFSKRKMDNVDLKREFKSYVYQTALLGNPDDLLILNNY